MAKKQSMNYFNNFIECAEHACEAARLLKRIVNDFDETKLEDYLLQMHEIETEADRKKHELMSALTKSFITPIDREDIINVSHFIDELTDKIEDVLIRIYCNRITKMNSDVTQTVNIITKISNEVFHMMKEFADYKHSKKLGEHIININSLEEEADKLYINSMHSLHDSSNSVLDILVWRDVYTYLERCADTAEHIAGVVETVAMKND